MCQAIHSNTSQQRDGHTYEHIHTLNHEQRKCLLSPMWSRCQKQSLDLHKWTLGFTMRSRDTLGGCFDILKHITKDKSYSSDILVLRIGFWEPDYLKISLYLFLALLLFYLLLALGHWEWYFLRTKHNNFPHNIFVPKEYTWAISDLKICILLAI